MFSKIKNSVITAVFLVVLAIAIGASLWAYKLNGQVDKLETNVHQLSIANEMLIGANDSLVKALDLLQKSSDVTERMSEELRNDIKKVNDGMEGMKKITTDRLNEIDSRYDAMEDTPENRELRRVDIALERSRGVWRMYCIAEPMAKECVND